MANTIKIKRGLSSNLPTLEEGELALTTDNNELYVGTESGNTKLNGGGSSSLSNLVDGQAEGSIRSINAYDEDGKLLGANAQAFGTRTQATGQGAHAEGGLNTASGMMSHVEGLSSTASGSISHAEGNSTKASGIASHAEGVSTEATVMAQHAQGKYSISDSTSSHIVGNGTSDTARSNAHTIDWSGNAWFAGDVYVGSTSGTNKDEGSVKLQRVSKFPFLVENEAGSETYYAEYGMTYEDFVNSSYNTGQFTISDNYLIQFMGKFHYSGDQGYPSNTYVKNTDIIIPGTSISYCCFSAGSQVLVSLDGETKNIEDLKENDQIVIYNEDTKQFELSTISKHITKQGVTDQAQVILENDTSVTMNAYHPLLTTEGYHSITNFEGLPTLTKDDTLVTTNGNIKIKEIIRTTIEPTTMYNLSVNGVYHNFIVNSIVSHNAPEPC